MPLRLRQALLVALGTLFALAGAGCAASATTAQPLPTATAGLIRITTDSRSYAVSQPIGITVSNTTAQSFYAVDGHAGCTYLVMQRYDATDRAWLDASDCTEGIAPRVELIAGGLDVPFTLTPGSSRDINAWAPGQYRVALTFSAEANGVTSAQTAYSAGFTLH